MPHARLGVELAPREAADGLDVDLDGGAAASPSAPHGVDEVELLLAPHPGAPARPIAKGASGGELSRVMLADRGGVRRRRPGARRWSSTRSTPASAARPPSRSAGGSRGWPGRARSSSSRTCRRSRRSPTATSWSRSPTTGASPPRVCASSTTPTASASWSVCSPGSRARTPAAAHAEELLDRRRRRARRPPRPTRPAVPGRHARDRDLRPRRPHRRGVRRRRPDQATYVGRARPRPPAHRLTPCAACDARPRRRAAGSRELDGLEPETDEPDRVAAAVIRERLGARLADARRPASTCATSTCSAARCRTCATSSPLMPTGDRRGLGAPSPPGSRRSPAALGHVRRRFEDGIAAGRAPRASPGARHRAHGGRRRARPRAGGRGASRRPWFDSVRRADTTAPTPRSPSGSRPARSVATTAYADAGRLAHRRLRTGRARGRRRRARPLRARSRASTAAPTSTRRRPTPGAGTTSPASPGG